MGVSMTRHQPKLPAGKEALTAFVNYNLLLHNANKNKPTQTPPRLHTWSEEEVSKLGKF